MFHWGRRRKVKRRRQGRFRDRGRSWRPQFNGTYERTEAQAEDNDREGSVKCVKQGGDGEYMAMGGKEEKPLEQKDAAVWNMETPIYDGEKAVGGWVVPTATSTSSPRSKRTNRTMDESRTAALQS